MNQIWNKVKLWSSQLWTQLPQLRKEAWKFQDFNGVWTRELGIPVRRSNHLSYEATAVGSWSRWSPEFFRLLYAIAKVAFIIARIIASLDFISTVHIDPFRISFHPWFFPHGNIRTHKWPAPNVSAFIAQFVGASHRYREVTGSNPVEVLDFSAFFTQLQKLRL